MLTMALIVYVLGCLAAYIYVRDIPTVKCYARWKEETANVITALVWPLWLTAGFAKWLGDRSRK